MKARLNAGKNIWTGKKVTAEDMETVDSINRKALLYKILEVSDSDKQKRHDFSIEFLSFLTATGELFYRNTDLAKIHEGNGTEKDDFYATMVVVSRYLATKRVLKQKTTGLREWELRSTSQEIKQEEINEEQDLLLDNVSTTDELYHITRLVYGMLRYKTGRDRIIPLLKDMGKDFAAG